MNEATEAAHHWDATITAELRNRENAVYALRLPDGSKAALRLHRLGYQTEAAIRSELWWCSEMAARGLPVPAPLPDTQGNLLPALSTGRRASVVSWIDGAPFGEAGIPLPGSHAEKLGRHRDLGVLLARMHQTTDTLTLPEGFSRPRWDIDGLVGETPFWGRFWEHPLLSAEDAATLTRARAFLRERLLDHAAPLGLVHADVLRENILVTSAGLALIDFDDSGFGYRLYDLGTVLSQDLYEPDRPALQAALIEGYASLCPIDAGMVPVFTLARVLASVGWVAPRLPLDHPVHRSHIARAVMWARHVMAGGA
jgi:Ser/Thr protein kinase RdoA (MazF antagonist)